MPHSPGRSLQLSWQHHRPPTSRHCWSWQPAGLADLSRIRRELRRHLLDGAPGLDPVPDDAADAAVMALDELMSNAIRHGRAPVEVEVCTCGSGLLLLVSDRAAEDPPQPTSVRDPSDGGMGLGMVAATATDSGWYQHADVKVVWATVPEVD